MLSRPGQSIVWLHTQHDILHLVFLSALLIVLFWYLSRGPPRATTYLIGKTLLILHVVTAWSIMVLSHTCHDILDLEFLLVVSFWYFLLVVPSCWFVQKEKICLRSLKAFRSGGPPRVTTYLIGKTLLILHVVTAWSTMVWSHTCHDILDLEFLLVVSRRSRSFPGRSRSFPANRSRGFPRHS